jgi:hypothetical protein
VLSPQDPLLARQSQGKAAIVSRPQCCEWMPEIWYPCTQQQYQLKVIEALRIGQQ